MAYPLMGLHNPQSSKIGSHSFKVLRSLPVSPSTRSPQGPQTRHMPSTQQQHITVLSQIPVQVLSIGPPSTRGQCTVQFTLSTLSKAKCRKALRFVDEDQLLPCPTRDHLTSPGLGQRLTTVLSMPYAVAMLQVPLLSCAQYHSPASIRSRADNISRLDPA